MSVSGNSITAAIETMNQAIAAKIFDLRTCSLLICKISIPFFFEFIRLEYWNKY